MTKEEFITCLAEQAEELLDLVQKKNADYIGESTDPFACFVGASKFAGITVEQGIMWELGKKSFRLKSLQQGKKVNNESMDDNLKDIALYCMILRAWIDDNCHGR